MELFTMENKGWMEESHLHKLIFTEKPKESLMYANSHISHVLQLENSNNFSLVMGLYDIRYRKICTLLLIRVQIKEMT